MAVSAGIAMSLFPAERPYWHTQTCARLAEQTPTRERSPSPKARVTKQIALSKGIHKAMLRPIASPHTIGGTFH